MEVGMRAWVVVVMTMEVEEMELVATEEAQMAAEEAAAARPMARQEGITVEAATEADHQAASLEAGTGAGDQVASLEAEKAVKGETMEAVEDRCTSSPGWG